MKIYKKTCLRFCFTMLIGILLIQVCHAQTGSNISVKGTVSDESGTNIIGATVLIKERTAGTMTDENGNFEIEARSGETLEISYLGFKKQTVKISHSHSQSSLKIVLQEDAVMLEDIVVVGYGTTSKAKLTGAVSSVQTSDFKNRPITDVSLALQGKVPGVQVTQDSGQPGADSGTITVRGIGTLNDSSPLIIIDGFESSFDKVDPKDIESMTVLKDASSAAIYGNKAANGVILITTKKGKSGKVSIEYNGYMAVQDVTRYPSLLGSVDYLELYNEALVNSGKQKLYTEQYIEHFRKGENPQLYPDRDWADFYFKPAFMHNQYLKMSGGSDNLAFTLSLGYMNQDGIMSGTEYEKFNFRTNINTNFFNEKLKVGVNMSGYSGEKTERVRGINSTLGRIIQMHPMVNPKMEGYGWTGWFYDDAVMEAGGAFTTDTKNFNGNINAQVQILQNLRLEGSVNYDRTHELGLRYAPNVTLYTIETGLNGEQTIGQNRSVESEIKESTYNYGNLSSYATLSYWIDINNEHNFKVMLGAQQSKWDNKYSDTERKRLTADLPTLQVGDPATQKNSSWASEVRSQAIFGRFNYDYKEKYMFEANFRYDGSSKFAKDHKWGTFPSFSAGWRIGQEPFLKNNLQWIDDLKLRVSWGQLGNEKIWSAYAGTDILTVGGSNYIWGGNSVTGSATSYVANKDLTWETTTQLNIGLDFAALNSLTFSGDFYVKETSDILMQLPVSSTFGFTEDPWKNAGKMRNVGFEFAATYQKEILKGLEILASGNISFNRNKILDLKGRSPIIYYERGIIMKEGMPINSLYGYDTEGIYQSDEEIHNHLTTFDRYGNVVNSYSGLVAAPGDIRFKDQNGDGKIDMENDRIILGDPNPDFLFSFSLGAKYKGFDFTAFFQGVSGGEGWSSGELVSPFFNSYNSAGWMVKRWTPENPNNTYQRVYVDSQRATIKSAYYAEDLSYLRLKNIELGYTVPTPLLKKIHLTGARVFLSGQNLFTLTKYKGFDPERAGVDATNIYSYPLVRTFTCGINLTF